MIIILILTLTLGASRVSGDRKGVKKTVKKIKTVEYVVKEGDILYSIAHAHHTTIDELRSANNLEKGAIIRVGQKLKVPVDTYFPDGKSKSAKTAHRGGKSTIRKEAAKRERREYVVKPGDTLSTLAEKFGLKTVELAKANGFENPSSALIKVGQKLRIPSAGAKGESLSRKRRLSGKKRVEEKGDIESVVRTVVEKRELTHTVKRGDTLAKIAHKYGVKIADIRRENSLKKGSVIREGQKLKIVTQKRRKLVERYRKYKVANGDTLFTIARKNHLLLKDLMKSNDIGVTDLIRPGQILKIPLRKEALAKSEVPRRKKNARTALAGDKKKIGKKRIYKVRKGDSLWAIAKRNGLSVKELREMNGMKKGDVIHVGMSLKLEKSTPKSAKAKKIEKRYVVRSGDTLWKIAKRYGTTIGDIRRNNGLKKGATLRKGMKLTLLLDPAKSRKRKIHSKKSPHKRVAKRRGKKRRGKRDALAALEGGSGTSRASAQVIRTAKRYLGKRYVWGAEGPNKFDCSGFTQYVIKKSKGVTIPRISRKQAYYGKYVSRKNLKPGDLIFFDTSRRRRGYVNHVGIYIGNNKFIHASSARHRVVITSLNRPFYRARFKWGRRIN